MHKLSSHSVVLVWHSTNKWPYLCMPVKHCCTITMSSGQSVWKRVTKLKVIIMGTDGQWGSCRKMLNQMTFVICYLQFVERRRLQWQLSMSGISTHLKNGSMKLEAPKKMAAMYDLWGEYLIYQLFGIQPKNHKIAADEMSPNHFWMPPVHYVKMCKTMLFMHT
jgi:hypothetical protein